MISEQRPTELIFFTQKVPMAFLFEKLEVYPKALLFAQEARRFCKALPPGNYDIADQLRRAALSIPLNIAEGNGRWHAAERKQFFLVARGSAFECVPLLELSRHAADASPADVEDLRASLEEICRLLGGLIGSTKKNMENR